MRFYLDDGGWGIFQGRLLKEIPVVQVYLSAVGRDSSIFGSYSDTRTTEDGIMVEVVHTDSFEPVNDLWYWIPARKSPLFVYRGELVYTDRPIPEWADGLGGINKVELISNWIEQGEYLTPADIIGNPFEITEKLHTYINYRATRADSSIVHLSERECATLNTQIPFWSVSSEPRPSPTRVIKTASGERYFVKNLLRTGEYVLLQGGEEYISSESEVLNHRYELHVLKSVYESLFEKLYMADVTLIPSPSLRRGGWMKVTERRELKALYRRGQEILYEQNTKGEGKNRVFYVWNLSNRTVDAFHAKEGTWEEYTRTLVGAYKGVDNIVEWLREQPDDFEGEQ